jgi:hypothetical protein
VGGCCWEGPVWSCTFSFQNLKMNLRSPFQGPKVTGACGVFGDVKNANFDPRKAALETIGAAHGHGPPCVTSGERTLLSAWLKQGRDWLMLQGRAGLVL